MQVEDNLTPLGSAQTAAKKELSAYVRSHATRLAWAGHGKPLTELASSAKPSISQPLLRRQPAFCADKSKATAGAATYASLYAPTEHVAFIHPQSLFYGASGCLGCLKCGSTDLSTVEFNKPKQFVDFEGYGLSVSQRLMCRGQPGREGCGTFSTDDPEARLRIFLKRKM